MHRRRGAATFSAFSERIHPLGAGARRASRAVRLIAKAARYSRPKLKPSPPKFQAEAIGSPLDASYLGDWPPTMRVRPRD